VPLCHARGLGRNSGIFVEISDARAGILENFSELKIET
jgi:hypothetical protein